MATSNSDPNNGASQNSHGSHDNQDESVLIIKHGALGDIILAQKVFRDIRQRHHKANITVLTTPGFAKLLGRCPYVDRVIAEQRGKTKTGKLTAMLASIRTLNDGYAAIYDLMCTDRTFIYRLLYTGKAVWRHTPDGKPIARLNLPHLIKRKGALQITSSDNSPAAKWLGDDPLQILQRHNVSGDYIMLVPGCSRAHPEKRWQHYDKLASALIAEGHTVLTAPGPDELDLATGALAILNADGSWLDLFALGGLLQQAKLVVGNDTGPTHIAAASGVATIMLMRQQPSAEFAALHGDNMQYLYGKDGQMPSTNAAINAVQQKLQPGFNISNNRKPSNP